MGHYVFIIVAGFIVAGTVLSMGLRSDTRDAQQETARLLFKEEARDAALTGINLTLRRIVVDEGAWTGAAKYQLPETPYKRSRFQTWITPIGSDTIDIESRGTKDYLDRRGSPVDTTHTVQVRIIRTQLSGGIPPAFKAAIITDKTMSIRGDFNVDSYDGVSNANIHANGTLETKGNSYLVEGYGTWTNNSSIKSPENFQPPVDGNGDADNVFYGDSIFIPQIDMDLLRADAQTKGFYFGGDADISNDAIGFTSFGDWAAALGYPAVVGTTPDQPFIVFSEGSISFTGNTNMAGFGAFVSVGDVRINAQTQVNGTIGVNEEGHPISQMGIFTTGSNLTINGGADITATIYSSGYTKFNGTASVTGGAVLNEVAKFTGTFNLTWAGFNEGFLPYFGGTVDIFGPTIAAWAEW